KYTDENGRRYRVSPIVSPSYSPTLIYEYKGYKPPVNGWACSRATMEKWEKEGKLIFPENMEHRIQRKQYLDEWEGRPIQTLWDDIPPINPQAKERLGYPTQKPIALLERIIQASSNPDSVILDPFCGCGTAIAAAQKLNRKWIGIDITHLSIALMKYRLEAMFPGIKVKVVGEPTDLAGARNLANKDNERYQFQWWALSLIRAKPLGGQEGSREGKKGSDKGIDGIIAFIDDTTGKAKRVLVQVISGHVNSSHIRDLKGTLQREQASIGVFITLEPPSKDMTTEAVSTGFYHSPGWNRDFPLIQILTIEELLHNTEIKMPPQFGTFKQAQRVQQPNALQGELGLSTG
ncbi:MAG TPA: DNA methyltransferase, partial [Methylomirabilota bacterium]|nr:DNA methyltransferase [Methylomirabilota bacterium]